MRRRIPILITGLAVLLAAGGFFFYQNYTEKPEPQTVQQEQVDSVSAAPLSDEYLDAEGHIIPASYANLSFSTGGIIDEILVHKGDLVPSGAPLARLDTTDQEIDLKKAQSLEQQAETALESARTDLKAAETGVEASRLAEKAADAGLDLLKAPATQETVALAQQNVNVAQAGLDQALAGQEQLLEGATQAEIDTAQAMVEKAAAERLVAQIKYDQADQNHATPDEMESLQMALNAAISSHTSAQAALDDLLAGPTDAEQRVASNAVDAARHQLEAAQAGIDRVLAGADPEEIAVASANVQQAQGKVAEAEIACDQAETAVQIAQAQLDSARSGVEAAQLAFDRRTLTAPFSGIVADIPVRQSEMAPAGVVVVILAEPGKWQIETNDLTELNVAQVSTGMETAISLDAFPDAALKGKVTDIARSAGESFGDVTYKAKIELPETDLDLRWGMTAIVRFRSEAKAESTSTLARSPKAEGKIRPPSFANLSFEIGGDVAEILVREGDAVQAGDTLIRLDSKELDNALVQAQASVASAQAAVAAAQADRQQAQAAVATAQDAVAIAQAQLALVQAGARTEDIAAARSRLAAAESAAAQAAAGRDEALDIGTPAQIQAAESEVAKALAVLKPLQQQYDDILGACVELPDGSDYCPLYGPVEEITRAQVQAAQAALAAAQAGLDQLNAGPTETQRKVADAAVTLAETQRDAARAELDLLLAGATPEQVEQASIAVEQAQAGVQLAQVQEEKAGISVQAAEAALLQAQVKVRAIQANIDRTVVRAPFSGDIVSLDARTGEQAAPGIPVITLAELGHWQVETVDLTELFIAQVAAGTPVRITVDALPGHTLTGRVTEIALVSNQYQGDIVYRVLIDLDEPGDLPLRWGMTAQVDFSQ